MNISVLVLFGHEYTVDISFIVAKYRIEFPPKINGKNLHKLIGFYSWCQIQIQIYTAEG